MENNTVKITGKIMETPEYLLTSPDRSHADKWKHGCHTDSGAGTDSAGDSG